MPHSVFFFLFGVYYACANFIPQADNWGYEDDLISDRFEEMGDSNPIVAGDFGDLPDNSLNLWRSNAVSVIPPSPNQIIADEKLPNEQPPSSEQGSPFGRDRLSESSPANVNIDPVICNSQYRPNVPGFSSKAKREDDVCRFGKPKCKEGWLSLCCYGSPLADEGGLTVGCVVCMSSISLVASIPRLCRCVRLIFCLEKTRWRENGGERSIQRFRINHLVDELSV